MRGNVPLEQDFCEQMAHLIPSPLMTDYIGEDCTVMKSLTLPKGLATLAIAALLVPMATAQPRPVVQDIGSPFDSIALKTGETKNLIPLEKSRIKITRTNMRRLFPRINQGFGARGLRPGNPGVPPQFAPLDIGDPGVTVGKTNDLSTVALKSKFPGINFTGWVPPDTHIAVGVNHVVMVVNSSIAVFNKSNGQQLMLQQFTNTGFLQGTGAGTFTFDPRVIYDPDTGKFVVIVLDVADASQTSKVHLAVSDTADPTGTWTIASIDNTLTSGGNKFWGDYPTISTTTDSYLMTFNHFGFTAGGAFGTIFAVSRDFSQIEWLPTNQFSVSLSKQVTAGQTVGHGVGIRMPSGGGNPGANVFRITKSGGTTSIANRIVSIPIFLPQSGGATMRGIRIDALGDRMMDSSQTGNKVVFALTVNVGPDNLGFSWPTSAPEPNHTKVRWGQLDISNFTGSGPTLLQSGDLDIPGPDSALVPAIIENTVGDIAVVATRSGPETTPRIVAASRRTFDPLGTLSEPVTFASSANFNVTSGGTSRWGDYAGIGVDPTDGTTFWGAHELLTSASLNWRTEFFSFVTQTAGGGTTQPPGTVTPIFGTTTAGNIISFAEKGDNNQYVMQSEPVPTRGNYAGYDISFPTGGPFGSGEAVFTVTSSMNGVTGFGYIYNFRKDEFVLTNNFRFVANVPVDITAYIPAQNRADYVGPANQVIFRLVAFTAERRTGARPVPFVFSTDFGELRTN